VLASRFIGSLTPELRIKQGLTPELRIKQGLTPELLT